MSDAAKPRGFMPMIRLASPALAAALLIALIASTGGIAGARVAGAEVYFDRVKRSIESFPYVIDSRWIGSDQPPQEAAGVLLKPNKIMQRRYVDQQTGASLTILIVHCKDVRDMVGHYPPACYPNAGWRLEGSNRLSAELGPLAVPSIRYEFSRSDDNLTRRQHVQSFFIMPGGPTGNGRVAADVSELDRAGRSARWTELGAAQIQILSNTDLDPELRDAAVDAFLDALGPVIGEIAGGVLPSDAAVEPGQRENDGPVAAQRGDGP